jgi:two-component system sensor histidine kinase KdpD
VVTVKAQAAAGRLRMEVVDHGPGVDPARQEEMFTPFQRLGDTSSGGVGLGLAIVRGLLDIMDGEVKPESTPGGGLTMSVTVPVAP